MIDHASWELINSVACLPEKWLQSTKCPEIFVEILLDMRREMPSLIIVSIKSSIVIDQPKCSVERYLMID